MKLRDRLKAASNAFRQKSSSGGTTVEMNRLLDFLGVDRENDNSAMSEATYFACLKVLSESVGKLPVKLQQSTSNSGVRTARDHRYYRMLNERPNRYMTASVFWSTMELWRNHYGNAYAWIDDDGKTDHPQLWLMNPENVTVYYDDATILSELPDVYYLYSTARGQVVLGSEEVIHVKSHYTVDGIVGISVRERLASTIKGGKEAQKLLNQMISSGMTAKAVLQYTGNLNDQNIEELVKGIERYASGELRNKGIENIIPLPLGMNLTPINVKLADSQFVELRQYTALQIASAFGVRPYQIGDYTKSSYSSAEAQQLAFLVDTLLYVVKGYEEEIAWKLLTDKEEANGYHVKFNTGVLLRVDQKTQIETLSSAVSNFLYTPNEAREMLDLPAKPGGDRLLGNGSSIPVEYTGMQYTSTQGGG